MLALYFAFLTILAIECSQALLDEEQATPHQFPYHVGLYRNTSLPGESSMLFYCQGTVITEKWILTAAYCLSYWIPTFVKAGKHIMGQNEASEQVRTVVRRIIHPEYIEARLNGGFVGQNDIAMIKVDTPFIFNEYVSAAVLPSASDSFFNGSLAGWYSPHTSSLFPSYYNELYYNRELVINNEDCNKVIKEMAIYSMLSSGINTDRTCSISNDRTMITCSKYPGSAFVSQEDDNYVVIGVVSKTWYLCRTIGFPIIYTRVGPYLEWIDKVVDSY